MKYRRYKDSLHDRKLGRDPFHRKLGGVCAGLARYLDVETVYVRIAAIIALFIAPQVTLLAYGIAYLVLDDRIY
jgi:phage shock protein PspC (stress-responsive transcriptional regulator)